MAAEITKIFDALVRLCEGDIGPMAEFLSEANGAAKDAPAELEAAGAKLSDAKSAAEAKLASLGSGATESAIATFDKAADAAQGAMNKAKSLLAKVPDELVSIISLLDAFQKREEVLLLCFCMSALTVVVLVFRTRCALARS